MTQRTTLTAHDRVAIDDLLARYAWALDTGDRAAFLETFTDDGSIEDATGRYTGKGVSGIPAFLRRDLDRPRFAGLQRWTNHLRLNGGTDRVTATSMLNVFAMHRPGTVHVYDIGMHEDILVRVGDRWLFEERIIRPWAGDLLTGFPEFELAQSSPSTDGPGA